MITSSPTLSAPTSPSAAFHRHVSSSQRSSPRFGAKRPATSAHSPIFLKNQPPVVPQRSIGTQYSPQALTRSVGTQYSPPSIAAPRHAPQRDAPAEVSPTPVTEPPEPNLRIDPQPVARPPNPRPPRRTSRESARHDGQPNGDPEPTSAASQDPASPAKRLRAQGAGVKVMPLKYETCDVKDLGVLISDMLMELVRLNDGFPLQDGQLTRFHSRAPPGISVRDYLNRLIVHATLSPPILLSMVFYVDKLCTMYPAFTISSLTVHRFLITAATVAAKGLSDSFWTNSLYARVGGVSLRELALLELEFLRRLEWRIVPKPETLVDYYKGLVERGEGYVMESEPVPLPAKNQAEQHDLETAAEVKASPADEQ